MNRVISNYLIKRNFINHKSILLIADLSPIQILPKYSFSVGRKLLHEDSVESTPGEIKLTQKLKTKFPNASHICIKDVSGGCGSMYEVHIVNEDFKGLKTLRQHQLVNEALKEEIKDMHGLRISTSSEH